MVRLALMCMIVVVSIVVSVPAQEPQQSTGSPVFDVASVRIGQVRGRGGIFAPPGEVRFDGTPLRLIVPEAFGLPVALWELRIVPSRAVEALWRQPLFVIHAKGDPLNDTRAMLRGLLRDRFGMRYHTETRQTGPDPIQWTGWLSRVGLLFVE